VNLRGTAFTLALAALALARPAGQVPEPSWHVERTVSFGGSQFDVPTAVALDQLGNVYVTGNTYSNDFPASETLGRHSTVSPSGFLVKLDPAGRIVYSTFLGMPAGGLAVDRDGNVYLAGADLMKVNAAGTAVLYRITLAGDARSVAVDASGNAIAAGQILCATAPAVPERACGGYTDVFVARIDASGRVVAATFFGGQSSESAVDVAIDRGGYIYVTGTTFSSDFPTNPGAFQRSFTAQRRVACNVYEAPALCENAFIAKLSPDASSIVYSTYFGGEGFDRPAHLAVDDGGAVYVTGTTASRDLPVTAAAQPACARSPLAAFDFDCQDGFVAKLNATGSALDFSTYLGGTGADGASAVALDARGRPLIAGSTRSGDFPITRGATQIANGGGPVVKSIDAGRTWSPAGTGVEANEAFGITVPATDPRVLYAASHHAVFRSRDGGRTWAKSQRGLEAATLLDLAVDPQTPTILYASAIGNVFKSVDGGVTWTTAGRGLQDASAFSARDYTLAIAPSMPSTIYVAYRDGSVYRSLDAGSTWNRRSQGPLLGGFAVDPRNAATVYAGFLDGVAKSTDSGATWATPVRIGNDLAEHLVIDPDRGTLYATGGGRDIVYISRNAGLTWLESRLSGAQWATRVALGRLPSVLYATTPFGGVYRSVDDGASWTRMAGKIESPFEVDQIAVDPSANTTLYGGVTFIGTDGFVVSIGGSGGPLQMSTYLGGLGDDLIDAIALGLNGRLYVVGTTTSIDFPGLPRVDRHNGRVFVAILRPNNSNF